MNKETRIENYQKILEELNNLRSFFCREENEAEVVDYALLGYIKTSVDALEKSMYD